MIKKLVLVAIAVVLGFESNGIYAEPLVKQAQRIPIVSQEEIVAFGDATYLFDHREYNTLTISGGFKNLPLGFNAWGFIDIHSDQNNESNRFDFTRYFLEYRLRRTLDPEWVFGVKGLGLEVEYNDSNGANNNLLRFGVNYKHDITLIAGQKSWLQWRYFPIQTNQYARSQASVAYRFGLTERLYISGFADFNDGLRAYAKGDYKTAIKEFQPLAEQGNKDAQFRLGFIYSQGQGVLKDYRKAVKWFRKAAEQDSAYGQVNLGIMYIDGMGVPKDLNKAKYWINKAYDNPNASSKTKDWVERIWNDSELWKY